MASDVMGSAVWNDFPGDDVNYLANKRYLLLGRPVFPGTLEPIYGKLHFRRPAHMLSVAPTGTGKGVSLIIPNLLSYRGSMLVVDPKGENAWVTAKWRREGLGNKVYILDPWGEVNNQYGARAGVEETVARLNPLASLDPKAADYMGEVGYFADALVVVQEDSKDPHWDRTAKELVAGTIGYVMESDKLRPEERTLGLMRKLLRQSDETLLNMCKKAKEVLGEKNPDSVAAAKLARFGKDTTETSGVFSAARTQTAFLDTMPEQQESDFSFDELAGDGQPATIYLVLPADKLRTDARWLRLMVSMAIRAVVRIRAPQDLPVMFMLDEFGTVGALAAIEEAYGLMRGYGMRVWAFLQDFSQLQRDYPKSWNTFISNSSAVTSFGVMDQETAELISRMLGTGTASYETHSESIGTSTSYGGNSVTTSTSRSASTSVNLTGRPLLMPDEVRRLNEDLCLVLGRHKPILCRRLVYYEDYPFYRAARFDPQFGNPERQIKAAEAKTAAALAQWAGQRVVGFQSARGALLPCGFKIEKTRWGRIAVLRGGRQVAKFRSEKEFVPWARNIMAEGFRRLQLVF
ncbi:MAG: type IV secretory system conjugative DNA transfer family protein [Terriglobia bacterium]